SAEAPPRGTAELSFSLVERVPIRKKRVRHSNSSWREAPLLRSLQTRDIWACDRTLYAGTAVAGYRVSVDRPAVWGDPSSPFHYE
ncbi:hypothetical protein NDU88_001016, partial [Pleurodeles waltl]